MGAKTRYRADDNDSGDDAIHALTLTFYSFNIHDVRK